MLLDANLLLYAVDEAGPQHARASAWLTDQLGGPRRVGLPWQSLIAFLRIATNPRAARRPISPDVAWEQVEEWLAAPAAWVPVPGPAYGRILGELIVRYGVSGNLVPDAQLAALALEHGLTIHSHDTDFVRFREVRWENPLVASY